MKSEQRTCKFPIWQRHSPAVVLAVSWCLGLLVGLFAASAASDILVSLMQGTLDSPLSIPGLLTSLFVPFLISAYAVYISEPWMLLVISCLKAFSFGFCTYGVFLTFGSSGWLVRILYLFSDICSAPVLYCYWLRNISGQFRSCATEHWIFGSILAVIGALDYWLVSPFCANL